VGVADIMKEAGLTHGGFYAHFASRDALLVEALERAGQDSAARLAKAAATRRSRGASALRALVESYLSEAHLRATDEGCPVAALASQVSHQAAEVREAAAQRVRALIGLVQQALPSEAPAGSAEAIASQMVGALQLARALGDNAQGKALLARGRDSLLERCDSAAGTDTMS
jgi:AcrR family transcriptional regulator